MKKKNTIPAFIEDQEGNKRLIGHAKVQGNNVVVHVVYTQTGDSVKDSITKGAIRAVSIRPVLHEVEIKHGPELPNNVIPLNFTAVAHLTG